MGGSVYPVALQATSQRVQLERIPAAADSDTATRQTIALMCRYIREAATDPAIQLAAEYAKHNYGSDSDEPAMLAWACFWFVKHKVRFVVDEAPMFRLGESGQQDLLIHPSVLIRMDQAQGDCDDFTMLVCALLCALGVKFSIVTIAADPSDPSRWSHVFPMALCPKALVLDASHGSGPGWCVPANHIFRWQAWGQNGDQVNIPRPQRGMQGWVPAGQGMGQTDLSSLPPIGTDAGSPLATSAYDTALYTDASTMPIGSASSGPGFNWNSFLNTIAQQAGLTARTAEVAGNPAAFQSMGNIGGLLPILGIGLAAFLLLSLVEKR